MAGMQFRIKGNLYDAELGLRKASLLTLFELKSRHGVGLKSLASTAKKFEQISDPMDLLEDTESFQLFLIIIWMARRYAGEKLTLEQANDDFALDEFSMVLPDAEEEAGDPKAPAASAPDAVPPMPTRTPSS